MRILKKTIVSSLLFAVSTIYAYNQSSINIHFGPSIPTSDFYLYSAGFESGYEITDAPKTGIATGLRYSYIFSEKNFGLFFGADFIFNKPNN